MSRAFILLALVLIIPASALAQRNRVTQQIDVRRSRTLPGSASPRARAENDLGAVDKGEHLRGLTLMFRRSAAQQADLEQLLEQQQDPQSPQYHRWLTSEEYADRFGLSVDDIGRIRMWLESSGLKVSEVARGRLWVVFEGDAGAIGAAFNTSFRRYRAEGETHRANRDEVSIPAALADVVDAVAGFDDFVPKSIHKRNTLDPMFTCGFGSTFCSAGAHYLVPDDWATIYNVKPLHQLGYKGSGEKIVIVGQSRVRRASIDYFRSLYNLPAANLTMILYPSSADPGYTDHAIEGELDLEWAGAIAPAAELVYVYGIGALEAARYATDQNLGSIVSISYGICELDVSLSQTTTYRNALQYGQLKGITWIAGSGDSGAASCDDHGELPYATRPPSVLFPASMPEVTAVGGTQFAEGGSSYWSSTNTSNGASATGYIPERAWNESGTDGLYASGGGKSTFYQKPTWQTGPGVPADGWRDVPDIALSAAGHDAYIIATTDQFGVSTQLAAVRGTSASAPAFAGIVALLDEYRFRNGYQSTRGMGLLNSSLYNMAQIAPTAFHDITQGDNIVPCLTGIGCISGTYGFRAGVGYDLVTGLGSINAYNLVVQWQGAKTGTTTTLSANPSTFSITAATLLTVTVKSNNGSGSVTGNVTFKTNNQITLGSSALTVGSNGSTATLTINGSLFQSAGNYMITATYDGSAAFGSSSGSTNVTVAIPVTPPVVTNQRVTKAKPLSCGAPPSTTSFQIADANVYLYFDATVTNAHLLRNDWLAPDGTVIAGGPWSVVTGNYCFHNADPLNIANLPAAKFGTWAARVYNNGSLIFTVSFTVTAGGSSWTGLGGSISGKVALVRNNDGRLEALVRNTDGAGGDIAQDVSGRWGGFQSLGGGIVGAPSAAVNSDGRVAVVVRGTDNGIYYNVQSAAGKNWVGWSSRGGLTLGDPAIVANADGRLEIFVMGSDRGLYHMSQTSPGGAWGNWLALGGVLTGSPVVARNKDGRLEVFVRGTDGSVYHMSQTSQGSNIWSAWTGLGGVIKGLPTIGVNSDGRLEIVVVGTDNGIWRASQITAGSSTWTGWSGLGGVTNFDPVIAANADGRLEVFVRGTDDALWHRSQSSAGTGTWSAWTSFGGILGSVPAVITNSAGCLVVLTQGNSPALYQISQSTPGSWN